MNQLGNENFLWESLTEDQQQEVLDAYEESEDESNLIDLSSIYAKFA